MNLESRATSSTTTTVNDICPDGGIHLSGLWYYASLILYQFTFLTSLIFMHIYLSKYIWISFCKLGTINQVLPTAETNGNIFTVEIVNSYEFDNILSSIIL